MKNVATIGGLLKKIYRIYSNHILELLEEQGFTDLRASFLEILMFLSEQEGVSIKSIGNACGLKKQTMTSHLNELQKRGYIVRISASNDKREQLVSLTEYGQKFKLALTQIVADLEFKLVGKIGSVELERIVYTLESFQKNIGTIDKS